MQIEGRQRERESEERKREPEQAEAHKVRRVKRNGFSTFLSPSLPVVIDGSGYACWHAGPTAPAPMTGVDAGCVAQLARVANCVAETVE